MAELADAAARARNTDGGWAYSPGKSSRLEPTCWALVGLPLDDATRAAARAFLERRRAPDGLLLDHPGAAPNLAFNGLAALALARASDASRRTQLLNAIAGVRGVQLENSDLYHQNNALQGWPWVGGAFSWVEPTAWCVLALKKHRADVPDAGHRIAEAETLLFDRACTSGGWNYGNSNMMGQDLRPYVPTTALALLALQDKRDHPAAVAGLALLENRRLAEGAGMPLALAAICLRVYRRPAADVQAALAEQWQRTRFVGNTVAMCMAAAALSPDSQVDGVFRL
jgi:hypothetical protein